MYVTKMDMIRVIQVAVSQAAREKCRVSTHRIK